MRTLRKISLSLALCCTLSLAAIAQDASETLRQNYPQLTEFYRDELGKYPTHYIFTIDVSGTMNRYANDVIPALKPFIQALPDGDRITIIPYGTDAKSSMPGFLGVVNNDFKQGISHDLDRLYTSPNYSKEFKAYTNIYAAEQAIVDVMRANLSEYPIVVIVQVGDFRNDVRGEGEHRLSDMQLSELKSSFEGITKDIYTRIVALELPVNTAAKGYCLDQLRDDVFADIGEEPNKGLEIVSMSTSSSAIGDWFERLRNDIMTTRLRAIVIKDNKAAAWYTDLSVNIDGKAKGNSTWRASRLYPNIVISPECRDTNFVFMVNEGEREYTNREEVKEKNALGKIRHLQYGFHHYNDTVRFNLTQPTNYDEELQRLNIKKPASFVDVPLDKWIFTFFMPFWLTALIAGLILLYFLLVLHAARRNRQEHFNGTVTIYDSVGRQLGDTINIRQRRDRPIVIGEGGTDGCALDNCGWAIVINKEKPNPLAFMKRVGFRWKARKGYVQSGRFKQGLVGQHGGKMRRGVEIECGTGLDNMTHTVSLRTRKTR